MYRTYKKKVLKVFKKTQKILLNAFKEKKMFLPNNTFLYILLNNFDFFL